MTEARYNQCTIRINIITSRRRACSSWNPTPIAAKIQGIKIYAVCCFDASLSKEKTHYTASLLPLLDYRVLKTSVTRSLEVTIYLACVACCSPRNVVAKDWTAVTIVLIWKPLKMPVLRNQTSYAQSQKFLQLADINFQSVRTMDDTSFAASCCFQYEMRLLWRPSFLGSSDRNTFHWRNEF